MDLLSNRSIVCLSLLIVLLSVAYNHCSWECLLKLLSFLPIVGSRHSSVPSTDSVVTGKTPINRPPPPDLPEAPVSPAPPAKKEPPRKLDIPETPVINEFGRIFTADELSQYAGEKGLYLSVLGIVYDVQKGEKFYAKGHTYHHFAGRDASRAFVTGDFTKDGLRDDVLDMKPSELISLQKWVKTYEKEYILIGRLIGRYYDKDGKPTAYQKEFEIAVERAHQANEASEEKKSIFPPCNTEWIQEEGGKVWCSTNSGGIQRDWSGLPRLYNEPDTGKTRCACIPQSQLNNPNLKEYPNCNSGSDTCITN